MPRIASITGTAVVGPNEKRLGLVEHVLFHECDPRVVGFEVERSALTGLIQRSSRFVALADAEIAQDGHEIRVPWDRLPQPASSAKAAGIDWDHTVIWRGMPVRTKKGADMGRVGDVVFGSQGGAVKEVVLTEGVTADAAVGRARLTDEIVVGFDGEAVVVDEEALEKPTTGGLATAAGEGTAVAKVVLGKATLDAARASGKIAGKTMKRLRRSAREWKEYLKDE